MKLNDSNSSHHRCSLRLYNWPAALWPVTLHQLKTHTETEYKKRKCQQRQHNYAAWKNTQYLLYAKQTKKKINKSLLQIILLLCCYNSNLQTNLFSGLVSLYKFLRRSKYMLNELKWTSSGTEAITQSNVVEYWVWSATKYRVDTDADYLTSHKGAWHKLSDCSCCQHNHQQSVH